MYSEGNIIYFTPFYFSNGKSAPKPKYFIILKVLENNTIVASLPTRKDSIPAKDTIEFGCIELPEISLNCFVISNNQPITECGKFLDFPTFIYGHAIDSHDLVLMHEIYKIEGSDYEIYGKMRHEIYIDLLNCLKNSSSVKQKFIRAL
jgi:hypothetical protein